MVEFDNDKHAEAWKELDLLDLDCEKIEPVGREHNGLEDILDRHLDKKDEPYLVCEIGSELGGSTRFFLDYLPNSKCVCIDPWPDEYKLPQEFFSRSPKLKEANASPYQLFLHMCEDYKQRILPIRDYSINGLMRFAKMNLSPDIIYVDGDHRYLGVVSDLVLSLHLFPEALLVGDDWNFSSEYSVYKGIKKSVQKGVLDVSDHFGLEIDTVKNTYFLKSEFNAKNKALNYTVA